MQIEYLYSTELSQFSAERCIFIAMPGYCHDMLSVWRRVARGSKFQDPTRSDDYVWWTKRLYYYYCHYYYYGHWGVSDGQSASSMATVVLISGTKWTLKNRLMEFLSSSSSSSSSAAFITPLGHHERNNLCPVSIQYLASNQASSLPPTKKFNSFDSVVVEAWSYVCHCSAHRREASLGLRGALADAQYSPRSQQHDRIVFRVLLPEV